MEVTRCLGVESEESGQVHSGPVAGGRGDIQSIGKHLLWKIASPRKRKWRKV